MREKTQRLPLGLVLINTVAAVALAVYFGYQTLAPDVYIPTSPEEYAAHYRSAGASYPTGQRGSISQAAGSRVRSGYSGGR